MKASKETLIKFLEKEGALEKFAVNILKGSMTEGQVSSLGGSTAIGSAFLWSNTEEGQDYWHDLEAKYRTFLSRTELPEELKNVKFYVKDAAESEKVQKALFKAGVTWTTGDKEPLYTDCPFLFLNSRGRLSYVASNSFHYFMDQKNKLIYVEDVFEALNGYDG